MMQVSVFAKSKTTLKYLGATLQNPKGVTWSPPLLALKGRTEEGQNTGTGVVSALLGILLLS